MKLNLCKNLRSKKMYVPGEAEELQKLTVDQAERFGHCWCNRTMAEVGPDDRQVGTESCSPSRPCFEQ